MSARTRAFGVLVWVLGAVCATPCLGFLGIMSLLDLPTNFVWFVPTALACCGYFGGIGYKVWSGWRRFDQRSARWVQPTPVGWRVRLEPSKRWLGLLAGLLVLGLCVSVVGVFSKSNPLTPPRWEIAVVVWLLGLVPLAILCWKTPPNRWLEVDEQAGELRWVHCRTGEHFVIPFSQIIGVRVVDARRSAPSPGMGCWFVNIHWRDDRWPQTTVLLRWGETLVTLG